MGTQCNEGMSGGASASGSSPLDAGSRSRGPADSVADAAYVDAFLAENMLNTEELGDILLLISPDYTSRWLEGQQRRHIYAIEQDRLFATMKSMSQCDHCGEIQMHNRMLTCGACRGYHYCNETCQEDNWPEHKPVCNKQVSKSSYRVASICSKMMTKMSRADNATGTNTPRSSGGAKHIAKCIDEHDNTEFVYAAVYEHDRLIFIPMPESVLQRGTLKNGGGETEKIDLILREKNVIVLVVAIKTTDSDGVLNCLLLARKTWVTKPPAP